MVNDTYIGVKMCDANIFEKLANFSCPDVESFPIIGSPLDPVMVEFALKIGSCN